ncbi:hypothetical protein GQ473_04625 [archaeon]|nr:hypothetical protein [archaeon]
MSVIKIKKVSEKEIANLIVKQETLQVFWNNNLIPTPADNNIFVINTIESTRIGKIFGRNIFGNRFNRSFMKQFTKLVPALNIELVDGKMSLDAYTLQSKNLILSTIAPLFDNVQGLTIEITQHFKDVEE